MNKTDFNKLKKDMIVICDYLAVDEKKHYEESDCPRNHIWNYVKRVKQGLKEQ